MAGVLHGSARTTPRVRAELQASQEATRVLAARYGLNPKTVAKWRRRTTTTDRPMGPARPHSSVLTETEEVQASSDRHSAQASTAAASRSAFQAQGSNRAISWALVRPATMHSST